jgi:hypothetical protein
LASLSAKRFALKKLSLILFTSLLFGAILVDRRVSLGCAAQVFHDGFHGFTFSLKDSSNLRFFFVKFFWR